MATEALPRVLISLYRRRLQWQEPAWLTDGAFRDAPLVLRLEKNNIDDANKLMYAVKKRFTATPSES